MTPRARTVLGALLAAVVLLSLALPDLSAPGPSAAASTPGPTRNAPAAAPRLTLPEFPPSLPLPVLGPRTAMLLASGALVLLVLPLAARSVRTAAWYWGLFAGPLAGAMVTQIGYPPKIVGWVELYAVWLLPLVALRFRRHPAPYRAGERWAIPDDLRLHRIRTWPELSTHVSAGAWWRRRCWWHLRRRGEMRPAVYGVDASSEGRHTLLVVPTGLGKGLWATTQLLTWAGSAIVNDLKGDLYRETAGWRSTLGPVYVLSAASPIHRFDPAQAAATEDDLRPLAHAISTDPLDRDPYWAQHAARALLVLMLAARQSGELVFPFVARASQGGAPRALEMITDIDPALADRLRPVGDSRPFASAWETLVTRCEGILSPRVLATLAGSDFTAADLLHNRATLYLQIPEARLGDLRPFLRLLWTSLIQQLLSASDRARTAHHPLLLILDEAGRTPFADLPDFLVTMRSRRISCAVLVQALSQLRAAYGEQASTILGNCAVHVYARSEDLATAEHVSERLGSVEEILPTPPRPGAQAGPASPAANSAASGRSSPPSRSGGCATTRSSPSSPPARRHRSPH